MAELAWQAARREADQLLNAYWDGYLPVKLGPITEALEAVKRESIMAPGLSGIVVKKPHSNAEIVLNINDPATRRRFTWAHELGHVVERSSIAKDDDYSFADARGKSYDLHEFYADEFAGALLMPKSSIANMRHMGKSAPEMAREFGVSVPAMNKRLERLSVNPT
ncbi:MULTISPECIES: ImmA/IrrE family metallo-endopeptidase [Glutamicibacter]|uniref:ImmA/IrrE family metallo-endopeptidase n=1 Tax=Glutamicibacter bergerei TaxID=256702 RepID=A0ABV9MT37_9MICC|nr:ImmA/IrrE family metallo-endopeptidase [Micrococcaceae bacterium]